jgi:hypothetical protein
MANDNPDPGAYPEEWGYKPPASGAVEAALDVFVSSLSDDEFNALVSRTRTGGR